MGDVIELRRREPMTGKVTVFDVANAFLSRESMTHKKLQKLCYYAYAWHLALMKRRLFNNRFEAWVHGPVCPDLYQRYRDYGWENIPQYEGPLAVDDNTYEFLESVDDAYGEFSGDALEGLSHSELPWIEARRGLEEWQPSHEVLDDGLITRYYTEKYEAAQSD